MTLRLLDLFAGAGGCSAGYITAGYDVTAVDLNPTALGRNPAGAAVIADAMDVLAGRCSGLRLDDFDVIHASPPCQAYSQTRHTHDVEHPDLLQPVLDQLVAWRAGRGDRAWIVENVPGAPMPGALVLCGSEFGLDAEDVDGVRVTLRRHRLFLSSVDLWGAGGCCCSADRAAGRIAGVYGSGNVSRETAQRSRGGYTPGADVARRLMGTPWMTLEQTQQAIPPAYAAFIGHQVALGLTQ